MYHPHGLVNTTLEFFWIGRVNWLSTEETALPALIIIGIWRGIPLFAVLYLAGNVQKCHNVSLIVALLRLANIIHDHVSISAPDLERGSD